MMSDLSRLQEKVKVAQALDLNTDAKADMALAIIAGLIALLKEQPND